MTEFKRFPDSNSRQIIDYNRFISITGEKLFVCLDRGIIEIARYLLNTRGSWRSTYVKEYVGTVGYNTPTEEEFQNVLDAIAEANIDMASCDDIVTAINGVTAAITSSSGSGGCGCVGSGSDDVTSVNDAPSQEIPGPDNWEELGFSSQEAYNDHRCNAAGYIINNYAQTLENWGGLFGVAGGLTLAIITGLLLLTVPPAGLMLIVAAFGILVGIDIGLLINLVTIAGAISSQAASLRCQLYVAETTEEARQALAGAAQAAVEALGLGSIQEAAFIQMTDNLISNEQLEILFDPTASTGGETHDCSECGDFPSFCRLMEVDGEGEIITATVLETNAYDAGSSTYIWAVGWEGPEEITFSLEGGSLTTHGAWPDGLQTIEDTANNCGAGDNGSWNEEYSTFAVTVVTGPDKTVQFFSSTPFRMRAEITG